jgi:hypothetical protein
MRERRHGAGLRFRLIVVDGARFFFHGVRGCAPFKKDRQRS